MDGVVFVGQDWWGWIIAGYLFLGGMAGASVPVAYYFWYRDGNKLVNYSGGIVAFLAMLVGVVLLVMDLGSPGNVMALATSPRLNLGSWMTIGTYIITLYMVATLAYTLQFAPNSSGLLARLKLARRNVTLLGLVTSALGLATAAYTGFLLAAARGVQFWNNPMLPVLFLASATSSGLCGTYCGIVAPILSWRVPQYKQVGTRVRLAIQRFEVYVLIGELFLLFAFLDIALWGPPGAAGPAREILYGSLAPAFWIGVVIIGIVLPLALLLGYTLRVKEENFKVELASALVGWAVVIGGLLLRFIVLDSGVIAVPLP